MNKLPSAYKDRIRTSNDVELNNIEQNNSEAKNKLSLDINVVLNENIIVDNEAFCKILVSTNKGNKENIKKMYFSKILEVVKIKKINFIFMQIVFHKTKNC